MNERKIIHASDLKAKKVNWLWNPYIPYGKVTILHGQNFSGKSLFLSKLIGSCTGKAKIDNGIKYLEPCKVLLMTGDKDLEGMVIPRLKDAGADLEKVFIVNDKSALALIEEESLIEVIKEKDIKLLVIDPFEDYLPNGKSLEDEDVTQILPIIIMLEKIAAQTGCAVVISSLSAGLDGGYSFSWNLELEGHVASYLCIEGDEDMDENERILYHERSLLTLEGPMVSYKITVNSGMIPRSFM